MGVPTKEELETALKHAALLREHGEDNYYLAKCLLNLNYRMKLYEDVLAKADLYLHSGEGAHEHALLSNAIKMARQASLDPGKSGEEVPT
jgi:hypothetical protein